MASRWDSRAPKLTDGRDSPSSERPVKRACERTHSGTDRRVFQTSIRGRQTFAEEHQDLTHGFSPVPTTRGEAGLTAAMMMMGPLGGPLKGFLGTTFTEARHSSALGAKAPSQHSRRRSVITSRSMVRRSAPKHVAVPSQSVRIQSKSARCRKDSARERSHAVRKERVLRHQRC
jgi:hypothetical protein